MAQFFLQGAENLQTLGNTALTLCTKTKELNFPREVTVTSLLKSVLQFLRHHPLMLVTCCRLICVYIDWAWACFS